MLNVVTGSLHADLEPILAEDLQRFKADDPFAPILIIVPSALLRQRLVWFLCVERGMALLNVQILTFHHLALRLVEEHLGASLTVRPPYFLREWFHLMLRDYARTVPLWKPISEMPRAWAALWATCKDLKDAMVDARTALEAAESLGWTQTTKAVLHLYQRVMEEKQTAKLFDHEDLTVLALEPSQNSLFLAQHRQVIYYGFYDLTQVQLDLFHRLARQYPCTLYFPLLLDHPACVFAQQFFDRYIRGAVTGSYRVIAPTPSPLHKVFARQEQDAQQPAADPQDTLSSPVAPVVTIVSVSGIEDEVASIAKQIIRWVEAHHLQFHEIGVVGRSLSGYETILPRVFSQHGIPFTSTMSLPLSAFPVGKAAVQALELRLSGFRRDRVLDLLSSPAVSLAQLCPELARPRPDVWDLATRRLGIVKGWMEWERIPAMLHQKDAFSRELETDHLKSVADAEQLAGLWTAVSTLRERLEQFPACTSWGEFVDLTAAFLSWLFGLDLSGYEQCGGQAEGYSYGGGDELGGMSKQDRFTLGDVLLQQLNALRDFPQGELLSFADFVAAFHRLMEEPAIPVQSREACESGVQVLDAMAARGVPFRALILIGLTEHVFPRYLQEDPFLKDTVRRALECDLGYKVPEKLAGAEEEKLLFFWLVNAAREWLTLLFQRTDQQLEPQVPSLYVDEVRRALPAVEEVTVPRPLLQKYQQHVPFFSDDLLTPREHAVRSALLRQPLDGWERSDTVRDQLLERGIPCLHAHEHQGPYLGPYDGMAGFLESWWQAAWERGFTPTAVERYARCPFQYFVHYVLGLKPLPEPETVMELGPDAVGTLLHDLLRVCFMALREHGYFSDASTTSVDLDELLNTVARPHLQKWGQAVPVGYAFVWTLKQQQILETLRHVLQEELAELGKGQWTPVLFEESMAGSCVLSTPHGPQVVPLQGRVDRVDRSSGAYRIIDYKYLTKSEAPSVHQILRDVMRGQRLQPPWYWALAPSVLSKIAHMPGGGATTPPDLECAGVWFHIVTSPSPASSRGCLVMEHVSPEQWTAQLRETVERTVWALLEQIRSGRFFIFPGSYCKGCSLRAICRKTHAPSLRRVRLDQHHTRLHRDLRKATPESSPDPEGSRMSKTPSR
ncbi:MAG: PD-(D/E)XK nuclease family protein [Nitrospirae bacterium]|nr:MAG: PD-(D/E)XK nuclease family protein [Nitrospirota bacterium]